MKTALLYFLLLLTIPASAQFGLSGYFLSSQVEEWQSVAESTTVELPGNGWQFGVDYWFRLKNTRIEFLPTLAFSRRETSIDGIGGSVDAIAQSASFFFSTNFYLLDLQGDCDCPTFSKQGPALQKGLFLQLSPGASYFDFNLSDEASTLTDNSINFNIGLALGLDVGLSDVLTISPIAGLRYYPQVEWASLGQPAATTFQLPEKLSTTADLIDYQLGIRLGLRLDD